LTPPIFAELDLCCAVYSSAPAFRTEQRYIHQHYITMSTVQQLYSLEGQTALVTGGTRGIGQSMAIALAEAGADILLVQVRQNTTPCHTLNTLLTICSGMSPTSKQNKRSRSLAARQQYIPQTFLQTNPSPNSHPRSLAMATESTSCLTAVAYKRGTPLTSSRTATGTPCSK
jgi:hypothetical protein